MEVSWRLSLGSPKVDPEAKTWLQTVTWEGILESTKERVGKSNRERDKLVKGYINERLLLWATGAHSWDPIRNHVKHIPACPREGREVGAFIH